MKSHLLQGCIRDGKDLVRRGVVIIGGGDVDRDAGHVGHFVIKRVHVLSP